MKTLTKVALSALSLASVAAISVAGTFAYLKDAESKMNVLTVGEAVDIAINEYQRNDDATALEDFEQGKKLYPIVGSAQAATDSSNMDKWGMPTAENYGDKIVTIENTGDADAKIRVFIAKPLALADLAGDGSGNTSDDPLHMNFGNRVDLSGNYTDGVGDAWKTNWGWRYNVEIFNAEIDGEMYEVATYYLDSLAAGAESTAVMAGVYLDSSVDYDDGVYTMTVGGKTYNINYDLSQGVTIPVYAEAVAVGQEFAADAETTFKNWATNVTGSVVADIQSREEALADENYLFDTKSGRANVAGYIVNNAGETINNLTVVDDTNEENVLFRAIYSKGNVTGDITINDSYLEGVYAMNITAVPTANAVLTLNGTTLKGWSSFAGFTTVAYNGCTFLEGGTYNYVKAHDAVVFTNCDFTNTEFGIEDGTDGAFTFINCTYNGVAITDAAQLADVVDSGAVTIG